MRFETLQCNNCGGPLSIPESVDFVTCGHCQSQLAVRRTENVSYTERLEDVERQTAQLSDQVRYLAWQSKLIAIDEKWEDEKKQYMVFQKGGHPREPRESDALFAALPGLTGLFFLAVGVSNGMAIAIIGGLAVIGLGIYMSIHARVKWKTFHMMQARYRAERAAITPESIDVNDLQLPVVPDSVAGHQ